jgi:hypothetical protein
MTARDDIIEAVETALDQGWSESKIEATVSHTVHEYQRTENR